MATAKTKPDKNDSKDTLSEAEALHIVEHELPIQTIVPLTLTEIACIQSMCNIAEGARGSSIKHHTDLIPESPDITTDEILHNITCKFSNVRRWTTFGSSEQDKCARKIGDTNDMNARKTIYKCPLSGAIFEIIQTNIYPSYIYIYSLPVDKATGKITLSIEDILHCTGLSGWGEGTHLKLSYDTRLANVFSGSLCRARICMEHSEKMVQLSQAEWEIIEAFISYIERRYCPPYKPMTPQLVIPKELMSESTQGTEEERSDT